MLSLIGIERKTVRILSKLWVNETQRYRSMLRDSKPQVKDNPAFLLELQQKMRAVEGIKGEVDRQRRYAIIIALVSGLIVGAFAMSLAYLYPVDPSGINDSIISDIRIFMDTYKNYLLLPIAGCAISLSLIIGRQQASI